LKNEYRGTFYLGLYTDAVEPAEGATLATIAELPVVNGYARIIINDADVTVVGNLATIAQKTFTAAGADWVAVTGWFICNIISTTWGTLICVESFSDGAKTVINGRTLKIIPTFLAA
jgi:hypothetical protein